MSSACEWGKLVTSLVCSENKATSKLPDERDQLGWTGVYTLNACVSLLSVSCGRPYNNRLNNGVESEDKGDRIPHPGNQVKKYIFFCLFQIQIRAQLIFQQISVVCQSTGVGVYSSQ